MTTNSADTADTAIAKEAVEANGAQSQRTNPPTLRLDNVSYAYAKGGKRVLKNISHDFQAGKVHAITGPSGAGKTTLLSLISGLATPTEGMVLVDGADLSERDRYRFRSHDIGVIFQSFNLLPNLTVAENIILSMDASGKSFDKSKKAIVEELLKQVHLPKEYTNERILHLSGGEQQRVAIARALSYGPSIIVADEPTGNIDPALSYEIVDLLSAINERGTTVLMVTHEHSLVKHFHKRIIQIHSGEIVADTAAISKEQQAAAQAVATQETVAVDREAIRRAKEARAKADADAQPYATKEFTAPQNNDQANG